MKSVMNGKLYDTAISKQIIEGSGVYGGIYLSPNGAWFRVVDPSLYNAYVVPLTENEAKVIIGAEEPDRYAEFFGEVEQA